MSSPPLEEASVDCETSVVDGALDHSMLASSFPEAEAGKLEEDVPEVDAPESEGAAGARVH